jgi:hypothetical protein
MKRPSRVKTVKPTIYKIQEFIKEKTLMFISPENEWLINNSIKISKTNKQFTFEIENKSFKRIDETVEDLDKAFLGNQMKGENKYFTCFPYASDNIKMPLITEKISGTLDSLIEGKESDFDNKFLRLIQPLSSTAKIGTLSDALDLKTDQEATYGVGIVKLKISNNYFDVFRISDEKKEFIFIDSSQAISIEDFNTSTAAFFQAYSYIFGFLCGGESYIVTSKTESFEVIDNILFKHNPEEKVHNNYIFNSHEIRELKFSDSIFLFSREVLSNMCDKLINEDKYKRTLNIIHEANLNEYSLSTCILFSSALETISSLIAKENNGLCPIDEERFKKSEITFKLKRKVEKNKILEKADKEFLIKKKLSNLNNPTNVDKLESPFTKFQISLPDNFKKALKYRNEYLHGSIPSGSKLGTFQADNFNRAFELQFLVNVITLKYVGYKGFLRNRSAEIEYNIQKGQGKNDEDISINQSLYYKI